ncbi:MAG: hypothetical protein R3B68_07535 [Phycisphaerales bacterium]
MGEASAKPRWVAVVGSVVGLLLVGAAVSVVVARRGDLSGAFEALSRAPLWMVALALGLPLVNWAVVSLALWVITARYGPVKPGEMLWLVGGAWLLNYLPMRPGMFGRVAYHKRVNGIPVRTSMGLLAVSMGLTAAAIAILAVLGVALRWARDPALEYGVIGAVGIAIALVAMACRAWGGPWRIATALLLRYVDMLVWVARYWIMFRLVGHTLGFEQACAIAAVSQAATAVPLSGNGLGLREWAVGLSLASLPAWYGAGATPAIAEGAQSAAEGATDAASLGMLADLVNRGVEMAIAVPVGLVGIGWVTRRLRRVARDSSAAGDDVPESGAVADQGPVEAAIDADRPSE